MKWQPLATNKTNGELGRIEMTSINIHLLHIIFSLFSFMSMYMLAGIRALGKFVTEKLEMEKTPLVA